MLDYRNIYLQVHLFQIKQLKAEVEKSPLMQKLREERKTNGSKFSKVAREALEARITKSEVIDVGQHMKEINKDTMQR